MNIFCFNFQAQTNYYNCFVNENGINKLLLR